MAFPYDDWQFWVVTAAALIAALWFGRSLCRGLGFRKGKRPPSRRAVLTVEGRAVSGSKREKDQATAADAAIRPRARD